MFTRCFTPLDDKPMRAAVSVFITGNYLRQPVDGGGRN